MTKVLIHYYAVACCEAPLHCYLKLNLPIKGLEFAEENRYISYFK